MPDRNHEPVTIFDKPFVPSKDDWANVANNIRGCDIGRVPDDPWLAYQRWLRGCKLALLYYYGHIPKEPIKEEDVIV